MPGVTVRKYGIPPYLCAVLHGGPGAPGYMAPVARELAKTIGVFEPLQTKNTLDGQIDELAEQLITHIDQPVTLVGSSWGAVLALFAAARNSLIAHKLILIGSAVFDSANSAKIESIRLERLDDQKRQRYTHIKEELRRGISDNRDDLLEEMADILFDADVFDPSTRILETIACQCDINERVWSDYVILRDRPGYLKREFSKIDIPVTVIHGEYDPHPIEGIRPFLEKCLRDVKFHILPECGHYPWIERRAHDRFFEILKREI